MRERPEFCAKIECPYFKMRNCKVYRGRIIGYSRAYRISELNRLDQLAANSPEALLRECAEGTAWSDDYRSTNR